MFVVEGVKVSRAGCLRMSFNNVARPEFINFVYFLMPCTGFQSQSVKKEERGCVRISLMYVCVRERATEKERERELLAVYRRDSLFKKKEEGSAWPFLLNLTCGPDQCVCVCVSTSVRARCQINVSPCATE